MSIFLNTNLGKNNLSPRQVLQDPVLFLAFGFGSGLAKKAPGTFGTLAALPLYGLIAQTNAAIYILLTLLITITGIWICGEAAKKLGEHDFSGIVWDEIAGYFITMWLIPYDWHYIFAGFILFRLFDIVKPWPIRWIDRKVGGGLGIMLDDVLAAIFANICLQIAISQHWL